MQIPNKSRYLLSIYVELILASLQTFQRTEGVEFRCRFLVF